MKSVSKNQIIAIQTMLSAQGLHGQKENIVLGFSDQRTTHVSELHHQEAAELVRYLRESGFGKGDKQRKLMIHYAHQMGWEQTGKPKVDMKRINSWCIKYGYLHKPLMKYTVKELPRLVQQFQKVYIAYLKSI